MKRIFAMFVVCLFMSFVLMFANAGADDKVELTTVYEGVTAFNFRVTPEVLKKQPKWGGEGVPPFSLTDAIEKARACLNEGGAKLLSVELSRIIDRANLNDDSRWYYLVSFSTSDVRAQRNIVVLLDGTVVPSEKAK